jgi:HK97 family phage major capsid protein
MISQLKEERAALIAKANAILTGAKGKMNAEQNAQFDAIYADADALSANITRAERAAAAEAELRGTTRPEASPIVVPGAAAASAHPELRTAFLSYLKNGKHEISAEHRSILNAYMQEKRALNETSGASGAYLIPQGFSDELERATKWYGGMRQVAKSFKTATGNTMPWPTNNDTSNTGELLGSATVPGTVDEGDTTFGVVNFAAWTLSSKYIPVSNELLQDSYFDLIPYLASLFNERLGRIENTLFTNGTGTNQPGGLITGATVGVTAATGGTTTITYNNLVDTLHSVDPSYRTGAKWMLHDSTLQIIRKITDNYGRPLLAPGLDGAVPDQFLGFKYQINQDFPTAAANAQTIAFGALDKYLIRDVQGIEVKRLDEIAAYQNQTVFLAFARVDGHLLDAGTHPVKLFQQSAS